MLILFYLIQKNLAYIGIRQNSNFSFLVKKIPKIKFNFSKNYIVTKK